MVSNFAVANWMPRRDRVPLSLVAFLEHQNAGTLAVFQCCVRKRRVARRTKGDALKRKAGDREYRDGCWVSAEARRRNEANGRQDVIPAQGPTDAYLFAERLIERR